MSKNNCVPAIRKSPQDRKFDICYLLLSLCFAVGCVLGSLFCDFVTSSEFFKNLFLFSSAGNEGFLASIVGYTWFHFLVLIFGVSVFGFVIIPFLTVARAFVLSCISSTIITSFPNNGLIMALVIVALPALFSIPVYIAISADSLFYSHRLWGLSRGAFSSPEKRPFARSLQSLPLLVVGAFINFALVPYLVSLLS